MTITDPTSPTNIPISSMLPLVPTKTVTAAGTQPKHAPLGSLIASAQRLTRGTIKGRARVITAQGWQTDAFDMYDLVGELWAFDGALAGKLSQARLYVGTMETGSEQTDAPTPVDDEQINSILDSIGGGASGLAQLMRRCGLNLSLPGEAWWAGIPNRLMPPNHGQPVSVTDPYPDQSEGSPGIDIHDLTWRVLSVAEISSDTSGNVTLQLGGGPGEKITVNPDDIFLVRTWDPHPRKSWEANSPARASLPVLRELVGLTMLVSAHIDSRLSGAGVFYIPASYIRALAAALGVTEEEAEAKFTAALTEVMVTPISDRASTSSVVPFSLVVPDEAIDKFRHQTFSTPLDGEAKGLRDDAIRRLALGQDAPPENMLGSGAQNHWGQFLSQIETVASHVEPKLALICDSLTTQFLWPVLMQTGMDPEGARRYVIWYDTSDLVTRPNKSTDATNLHDRGVLSDEALRTAAGFDEVDAPEPDPRARAFEIAMQLLKERSSVLAEITIPELVDQIEAAIRNETAPAPAGDQDPPSLDGGPGGTPTPPPGVPTTDADPAPDGTE